MSDSLRILGVKASPFFKEILVFIHIYLLVFVRFSVYNNDISTEEAKLPDYISVKETAEKWGISERRVQKLCEEDRIEGIVRFGHAWMIPREAEKPADQRRIRKKD